MRVWTGRPIQVIGAGVCILCGLGTLLWTWYVLFAVFGALALLLGLFLTPITYLFSVLVVWFSTGEFPVLVLFLWLGSIGGAVMMGIGGMVAGDD
jgi:hypothetical protein